MIQRNYLLGSGHEDTVEVSNAVAQVERRSDLVPMAALIEFVPAGAVEDPSSVVQGPVQTVLGEAALRSGEGDRMIGCSDGSDGVAGITKGRGRGDDREVGGKHGDNGHGQAFHLDWSHLEELRECWMGSNGKDGEFGTEEANLVEDGRKEKERDICTL